MDSETLIENNSNEKYSSDSEINGDKPKMNDDLTMEVESEDSTNAEAFSEENDSANTEETVKESEISEESKEALDNSKKNEKTDEESEVAENSVTEPESPDKTTPNKHENVPPSPLEGLGKGKRARVPNKRYSDIALSPPPKITKITPENGENKPNILERVEYKPSGSNSPTPSKRQSKVIFDPSDPNFLKPFKYGWKRELVWRSSGTDLRKLGDIYYYSPQGKKLRSMREVSDNIKDTDLTINDFTFVKVPLKVDSDKQIVRGAKVKSAGFNSTSVSTKNANAAKTKKVASPKTEPKAEAAPASTSKTEIESEPVKNARASRRSNAKTTLVTLSNESGSDGSAQSSSTTPKSKATKNKAEKKTPTTTKQTPVTAAEEPTEDTPMSSANAGKKPTRKSGRYQNGDDEGANSELAATKPCQPCSIRCLGVQGLVPTLQCRLCLCLYHNECVGLSHEIIVPNYVCKNCQLEQDSENITPGIAPPPLTPITALQSINVPPTTLPRLQRIPKNPEKQLLEQQQVQAELQPSPLPLENQDVDNTLIDPINSELNNAINVGSATSILGHVTSWLPQNSRIQLDDNQQRLDEVSEPAPRPQYVEYLNGRKFLIIPKYNVVSVSPTVVAKSGIQAVQDVLDAADVPTTVKNEPISPSKPECSQTFECERMDVDDDPPIEEPPAPIPTTTEVQPKISVATRRKTIKLEKVSNDKSNETIFMENYLQNLSYGYNALRHVFQYLKVQDLLRAGCVCTMWRDIANHRSLWNTVRMKNSQVRSFEGLANALKKHGTVCLDLRKMLLTNNDEVWTEFSSNIGKVKTLRKIELCRCPASVVESLMKTNSDLEVVNAVTIRCEEMDLEGFSNWKNLKELRLKSTNGLKLTTDLNSLSNLKQLKCLSLTSIKDLHALNLDVIAELTDLESLDLGECTNFPDTFGKNILSKLVNIEKLRLEKGQGDCHTFELLEAVKEMKSLEQLELVNFDIKTGFDKALGACKNIKKLLIIPTYISQSATTNHMVLGGVLRLQKSLSHFVWGVTLELLRVTELFVDQCEKPEKKDKKTMTGDSIPVLKPVPLITDHLSEIPPALDPPQVEILALPGLQKLLLQSLPTTRVKILKIPFHATWRQSITDAVN